MAKRGLPVKPAGNPETGHPSFEKEKGMAGFDVGLRLVVAVMGLGGIGLALDKLLGTLPWLMLGGIILGFVGWMVSVAKR